MSRFTLEGLEPRLSMTTEHGDVHAVSETSLTVTGTNRNDRIVVVVTGNPETETARVRVTSGTGRGKTVETFRRVTGLTIQARHGDDTVIVRGNNLSNLNMFVNVLGGNGNDNIKIGPFDGSIGVYGDGGNDVINCSRALINGSEEQNRGLFVYGGDGGDTIIGSDGNDTLHGGNGNDTIFAQGGDDYLTGGPGRNFLFGEDGNDTFGAAPTNSYSEYSSEWTVGGNDAMSGGEGDDTVIYTYNREWTANFRVRVTGIETTFNQEVNDGGGGKG